MNFEKIRDFSITFGLIVSGVVIGALSTTLALSVGKEFFDSASIIGFIVGAACIYIFLIIKSLILSKNSIPKHVDANNRANIERLSALLTIVIKNIAGKNAELVEIASAIPFFIRSLISALIASWGAITALSLAVAAVGVVVSMATVVASYRQVDRMDQQNLLIKKQTQEALAARISSVFSAQLPSLLSELKKSKVSDWKPGPELVARIQTLIYGTQPYASDNYDNQMYSPERAQLLILLISVEFPFRKLDFPLDFSYSDFRGLRLSPPSKMQNPESYIDLGETDLSHSNFSGTKLEGIDFSSTNLSESILPKPSLLQSLVFLNKPKKYTGDSRLTKWIFGANISGAKIERELYIKNIAENSKKNNTKQNIGLENSLVYFPSPIKNGRNIFYFSELWDFEKLDSRFLIAKSAKHTQIYETLAFLAKHEKYCSFWKLSPLSFREIIMQKKSNPLISEVQLNMQKLSRQVKSGAHNFGYASYILSNLSENSATCYSNAEMGIVPYYSVEKNFSK